MNRHFHGWLAVVLLACALLATLFTVAAQTTRAQSTPKLLQVHLDGSYFSADGKRFLPIGAHWVPAKEAMQGPVQWDPKDIEADYAKMQAQQN